MNVQLGAHEVIGMNEALMTKAANAEILSSFSLQAQDKQLKILLQRQAQVVQNHYNVGVSLLQGYGQAPSVVGQYQMQQYGTPQIGLNNPTMPAPQINVRTVSDRTMATAVLNMHKHGCIAWMTFALECTNPQLRQFLANGANMCDRMAYETWSFMNSQGYYQVPKLPDQTMQTMVQAFQPVNTNMGASLQ